jgi:hypothetical protein
MALLGRYLSPVACDPCVEGLPLLVLHFCSVHAFRLFWGAFNLYTHHQIFYTAKPASGLYGHSIDPEHLPYRQP